MKLKQLVNWLEKELHIKINFSHDKYIETDVVQGMSRTKAESIMVATVKKLELRDVEVVKLLNQLETTTLKQVLQNLLNKKSKR